MTPTRWLITLFWLFIGAMLVWQFLDYNSSLNRQEAEHPTQQHFFYYPANEHPAPAQTPGTATGPQKAMPDTPALQQMAFWVDSQNAPPGNFTAHVTVKNVGTAKAVAIQVCLRPYRGITVGGDEDNGTIDGAEPHVISDNDPLAQINQWINLPDLAPGESVTGTATFFPQPNAKTGSNPHPDFIFNKAKPGQ